jgi:hypothetical protein
MLFGAEIIIWCYWNDNYFEMWYNCCFVLNAKIIVGGRVTGIHWITDTWRVRVWIQIHTHECLWVRVWVEFCLAGIDLRTIYLCTICPIAIPARDRRCSQARGNRRCRSRVRGNRCPRYKLILGGLGCFYSRPNLVRLKRMAPLSQVFL